MTGTAAKNELESLILEMHAGGLEPEVFVARLLDRQVFIPVKDDKHRIAINPGLDIGFDFDPEMVAMAAALLPEAEQ